jgi:ribosomal protein S27AE
MEIRGRIVEEWGMGRVVEVNRHTRVRLSSIDPTYVELYRLRCPNCGRVVWQEYADGIRLMCRVDPETRNRLRAEHGSFVDLYGKICPVCGYLFALGRK